MSPATTSALCLRPAAGRCSDPTTTGSALPRRGSVVSWPLGASTSIPPRSARITVTARDDHRRVAPREFFGLQIGIQADVWIPRRTSR
jgi:hypothetical protein